MRYFTKSSRGGRDGQLCLVSQVAEGLLRGAGLSCGLFCVSGAGREDQGRGQSPGLQPRPRHSREEAEPVVRDPLPHGWEKSKPQGKGFLVYFAAFYYIAEFRSCESTCKPRLLSLREQFDEEVLVPNICSEKGTQCFERKPQAPSDPDFYSSVPLPEVS